MEEDFANSPRRFSWAGRVRGWLGAWRGGEYLRRDPKLAVYRARTRFRRLGRGKGSCGVGKSFIGLGLTPLARKSRRLWGRFRPDGKESSSRSRRGGRRTGHWQAGLCCQSQKGGREGAPALLGWAALAAAAGPRGKEWAEGVTGCGGLPFPFFVFF